MNRRLFLSTALGFVLAGGALPGVARADARLDDVIRTLRRQGYSEISVGRTLLGRTRIVANGRPGRREIVLNPRTGEIMRDIWDPNDASGSGGAVTNDDGGNGSGGGDDDGDDNGGDDDGGGGDDGGDDHGGDDHGGDSDGGDGDD